MKTVQLYFRLAWIAMRSQMQYRASFIMLAVTHFLSTFVEIVGIWVLFDRFKMVQGWTLAELALIYGIMHMGFAIAEASARGFDTFSMVVKNGDFDRVLLRPCGTLVQIATRDFQMMRIGRFFQGLLIFLWSSHELQLQLLSYRGIIVILALIGTVSFFYALFIIQATLCFWTTETLELMNILTYGGLETGQYPMSIYPSGFRFFFTFIIPLACVAYYPVAILLRLEHFPLWMATIFPFAGIAFLLVAFQLWSLGVRHYHSSGS